MASKAAQLNLLQSLLSSTADQLGDYADVQNTITGDQPQAKCEPIKQRAELARLKQAYGELNAKLEGDEQAQSRIDELGKRFSEQFTTCSDWLTGAAKQMDAAKDDVNDLTRLQEQLIKQNELLAAAKASAARLGELVPQERARLDERVAYLEQRCAANQ